MLCIAMRDASPRPLSCSGRTALPTSPALSGAGAFTSMVGLLLSSLHSFLRAFRARFIDTRAFQPASPRGVQVSSLSMLKLKHGSDLQCANSVCGVGK